MLRRILTAIPALVLLAAAIFLHGYFLIAALGILSLIAEYEMISTAKKGGIHVFGALLYIFTALLIPSYIFFKLMGCLVVFTAFIIAVCIAAVTRKELSYKRAAYTIALFIYPQLFFMFLIAISVIKDADLSRLMLILLFGTAILTDTFAYFIGRKFGKRKLCPIVSPNKTIAGAVGGVIGGLIASLFIGGFIQGIFHCQFAMLHYLLLGFIMSILSELGDLTASLVKREFGVKDYGFIMPGHGGVMDRLDSIIFIAPVLLFYFMYIVQISV